jgi:hypothetical protein
LFQTDKLSFEILLNIGEEIPYEVINESGDMGFVLKISDFITGQNLEEGFNH